MFKYEARVLESIFEEAHKYNNYVRVMFLMQISAAVTH